MFKSLSILALVAATIGRTLAVGVSGKAEGFASGVTGGGSASPVYPKDIKELVSYLGDSSARVIVLQKTYDFTGSEGTGSGKGCLPWGTGSGCQVAIDQNGWCENYEASAPKTTVSYDKAGVLGITVASHKTLIGVGSSGVIKGKGLRIVSGASNIIIQNIAVTDINPKYVWGGDAITIDGADLVWIDHVTTARIGRQHIVLGESASNRVTISNNYLNGASSWSATCDGHHYWGMYFTGSNDLVTLKGNYFLKTSGRMPKVQGNTLLHAVNNYWSDNSGHGFEIGQGGYVLMEGNVFSNVKLIAESPIQGQVFTSAGTSANAQCSSYLGRACVSNNFGSSAAPGGSNAALLAKFKGKSIASASAASGVAASVQQKAGQGKI